MQREEAFYREAAMGAIAAKTWRVLTAPVRLVAEIVRIPREFRRQLFVRGRGSDTGNVSPLGA
jgi:hypothetical protein